MAVTLEQQSRNNHHAVRVSFDDSSTEIHETIHVADFTNQEKHACWMSSTELNRNKLEVKSMARKLSKPKKFQQNHSNNDDTLAKECSKKIEIQYSEQQQQIRQLVRRQAQLAVFEEQEFQWMTTTDNNGDDDTCFYNDERIASVYQKQTLKSHRQAQKIGQAMASHGVSSANERSLNRSYSDSEDTSQQSKSTSIKKRLAEFTRSRSLLMIKSRY